MKKIAAVSLLITTVTLLPGCASMFSGTSDVINFDSKPEGAAVRVNGLDIGRTPVTAPIKRSLSTPHVQLRLDGYESQHIMLQNEFNPVTLLNIFIWPGFIVDAATGAIMKYQVTNYDIELNPNRNTNQQ